MSLIVYFDTNIFDNLIKNRGGVSDADEAQLRATIFSRQMKIVASHINILETLAALHSRPEIARAQLSLIASLVDWNRFVKFSSEILEHDIKHFAFNGERANTPFESNRSAAHIRSAVQRVIDARIGTKELEAVIREDREQKRAFLNGVRDARAETSSEIEEFRKRGEIPTFEQWFEDSQKEYVLAFIKSFGVAEDCQRRGLDNLLKIPSVRAMVSLGMSFIYRTAVERKAAKSSASRDLQHAACAAAAADIFVTHDEELVFLLRRVPIKSFRVMTLRELLEDDF